MKKVICIIAIILFQLLYFIQITNAQTQEEDVFDAIGYGQEGMVRSLVKNNPELLKKKDKNGYTLLIYACRFEEYNNKYLIDFFVLEGADVNERNNEGWTSLHYSAEVGSEKTSSLLLKHHAAVNTRNNAGETPLDIALKQKYKYNEEVVKILLSHGADINLATFKKFCEEKKYANIKLYLVNNWKPKIFLLIIILFVTSLFLFKMIHRHKNEKKQAPSK